MKNVLKYIFYISIVCFFINCNNVDDTTQGLDETETNPNLKSIPDLTGNWKMVVESVETYEGSEEDEVFINILTGKPIPSGIETTNTTNFTFDASKNKIDLILRHGGWDIWEANGFYPIEWDFDYKIEDRMLTFEGLADMFLSNCQPPPDSMFENKFKFVSLEDYSNPVGNFYLGYYVWSESYNNGVCIKISGIMYVSKISD